MDYLVGGLGIFCKVISFSIRTSIKTSKLAWQNGGKKISLMTVQGLNKGIHMKTYHLGKRAIIDSRETFIFNFVSLSYRAPKVKHHVK